MVVALLCLMLASEIVAGVGGRRRSVRGRGCGGDACVDEELEA